MGRDYLSCQQKMQGNWEELLENIFSAVGRKLSFRDKRTSYMSSKPYHIPMTEIISVLIAHMQVSTQPMYQVSNDW